MRSEGKYGTFKASIFSWMFRNRVFSFENELIRCWSSETVGRAEFSYVWGEKKARTPSDLGAVVMFVLLR